MKGVHMQLAAVRVEYKNNGRQLLFSTKGYRERTRGGSCCWGLKV